MKDIEAKFEEVRRFSEKYDDSWGRIRTYEIWEGRPDHKPADIIMAFGILEHQRNVDDALTAIKSLARVAVMFGIQLDAMRNFETWTRIIGKHFTIMDSKQEGSIASIIGSPIMKAVPGAKIVAAGTAEGWWDSIVKNSATIKKRVAQAPAHDVRAIIACYGPSLTDNLPRLVEEALEGPSNIISVSGAHDFLIDHGITPHYHVECDPRPHKADNINRPSHEVEYLLGSMVHPVLIEKLQGYDVSLFHCSSPLNIQLRKLEPDRWLAPGGSNVGLRSIGLFYEMGYRNFSMYGMDCSIGKYDSDKPATWAQQWAGPHASKANPKEHQIVQARCAGEIFDTTVVLMQYASDFWKTVEKQPDAKFRLYGEGLLQTMGRMYNANQEAA